jgi:hypothetical protein
MSQMGQNPKSPTNARMSGSTRCGHLVGRADPLVKLAHARCLVRRELALDFLRAKLCLPFLAGHWDGRDTVADKVHIAFNWLGRFSKASVKQRNRCGNSSGLGFALGGDFNERIDSGRAVLAGDSAELQCLLPFTFAGNRDCPIAPWKNRQRLSGSF